ncbi:MAG: radical SAM protein [Deltaproteobacteria bacterium]|nr:radical SAM protein [Deltaproteobacteria bacterium]
MTHLFGPVNSRRLGLSLGVDLIPPKTCTFDCIYCEVGRTTHLTLERRPFAVEAIIREIREYFQNPPATSDYITLAGSGEPTLNAGIGEIITAVKDITTIPVAVLTNGTLLYQSEVRQELACADVVLPSLDAVSEETFRRINRPAPGLTLEMVLAGLKAFRKEYRGQMWLEVMLLKGINDTDAELAALKREIAAIAPDKVQLNTAVRPVVENYARALNRREMEAIAAYLGQGAEIIASFDRPHRAAAAAAKDRVVIDMLSRRPMTARDLAEALGLPLPQVQKRLHRLQAAGRVSRNLYEHQGFYRSEPKAE